MTPHEISTAKSSEIGTILESVIKRAHSQLKQDEKITTTVLMADLLGADYTFDTKRQECAFRAKLRRAISLFEATGRVTLHLAIVKKNMALIITPTEKLFQK